VHFEGGDAALQLLPASSPGSEPLFGGGQRRRRPLGLTPLIDVVFLLVVFFMLASRFGDERKLVLDVLATAPASQASSDAPRRVDIGDDLVLRLQGEVVTHEELARSLARRPESPVLVVLAAEASLQSMVSVLETVGAAGVTRAALAPASR
jgi:biopolymer transport protein ExbD